MMPVSLFYIRLYPRTHKCSQLVPINPGTREAEFGASLGYGVRPYLILSKDNQAGDVVAGGVLS